MLHLLTSSRYYVNIPIASESEDAHLLTSSSYYVNIVNFSWGTPGCCLCIIWIYCFLLLLYVLLFETIS